MQKLINAMAISSFIVSAAVVTGVTYVYLEKDDIIMSVKSNIEKEIQGFVAGAMGGMLNSNMPTVPDVTKEAPSVGGNVPTIPF